MIKVYIFITGLVLYQFAPSPGGTSYAILVSGDYDYPGLAHIGKHELGIYAGDSAAAQTLDLPLEAKLSVSCPGTGCLPLNRLQQIPLLDELLYPDWVQPMVHNDCFAFDGGATCNPRGVAVPGRNGLLAFTGDWSVEALTDCGGNTYPSDKHKFVKMNFVRAGRAWELRYPASKDIGNTVLFTTVVAKMDDLQVSNAQLKGVLATAKITNCNDLYHFSGATSCAVVLIRNGSPEMYHGGGDLHFAPLYGLLENQLNPSNLWLPVALEHGDCGGGGSGGLSHCTGGQVPYWKAKP